MGRMRAAPTASASAPCLALTIKAPEAASADDLAGGVDLASLAAGRPAGPVRRLAQRPGTSHGEGDDEAVQDAELQGMYDRLASRGGSRPGTASVMGSSLCYQDSQFTVSRCGSRGGRGRLMPEEANCFKRVKTPSSNCLAKSEVYFQTTGHLRQMLANESWNTLPVLKGKFFAVPGLSESKHMESKREFKQKQVVITADRKLPEEEMTSAILEEILPAKASKQMEPRMLVKPKSRQHDEDRRDVPLFDEESDDGDVTPDPLASPTWSVGVTSRGTAASGQAKRGPGNVGASRRDKTPALVTRTLSSSAVAARASIDVREVPTSPSPQTTVNLGKGLDPKGGRSSVMLAFRHALLEKFSSINEACESMAHHGIGNRPMAKNEFRRVLKMEGFEWSLKEKDAIFADLDFQQVGHITLSDLQIAVEAAVPVRTVEDLRRRWLASGFSSMLIAARKAEFQGDMDLDARMTMEEFGKVMKTVNVMDTSEHQALFWAICSDRSSSPKVSLQELLAALAMVSPDLLLEDMRARWLKQYGSMDKAWMEMDQDKGGTITAKEFEDRCVRRLGFGAADAKRVFRVIDLDASGEISREEYLTALRIAEPSLSLEYLRLKVRRSFRSIVEALRTDQETLDPLAQDITSRFTTLPRMVACLAPLDFKESEVRMLFELVDILKTGEITVITVVRGIHYLSPSCAVEDLRARCIQLDSHVVDAFASMGSAQRMRLHDLAEFAQGLQSLHLVNPAEVDRCLNGTWAAARRGSATRSSIRGKKIGVSGLDMAVAEDKANGLLFTGEVLIQKIFDLLDVSNAGAITMSRVIAALQSCGTGSRQKLPPKESDERTAREVKEQLYTKHRLAADLKSQVRLGTRYEDLSHKRQVDEDDGEGGFAASSRPGTSSLTASSSPQPRRAASRSGPRSPERPGRAASPGSGERPGSAAGTTAQTSCPRLRTTPLSKLEDYMDSNTYNVMRLQGSDPSKPSQMVVQNAQDQWQDMWKTLQSCKSPDMNMRNKFQGSLHSYFQSAALSMSHDVPLLSGVQNSAMDHYKKIRVHKAALRL